MLTYDKSQKENGVVLLLILGFMAMFAVMVLTFIMITSNLSDSANSSVTVGTDSGGSTAAHLGASPTADAKMALKTALVGSNNDCSPIGPFGVLENLYGESGNIENDPLEFTVANQLVGFRPEKMQLIFQIPNTYTALNDNHKASWNYFYLGGDRIFSYFTTGDTYLADKKRFQKNLFRNLCDQSGTVLTFGDMNNSTFVPEMVKNWNSSVSGSSVIVVKKEILENADGQPYVAMTVMPSSELSAFLKLDIVRDCIINDPNPNPTWTDIGVRLNRPVFSGTGAGGFSPQSVLDGQQSPGDANPFRLPFAFWANAAAPDLTPYDSNPNEYDSTEQTGKTLNFRTFVKHLASWDYTPFAYNGDSATRGDHPWLPYFNADSGQWIYNDFKGESSAPIQMNPSYTAPDGRNLFLAHYKRALSEDDAVPTDIIPSYHRPDFLSKLLNEMDSSRDVDWLSVLRKMTPRPLRLDHWNFSGENDNLPALDINEIGDLTGGDAVVAKWNMYDKVTDLAQKLAGQGAVNPWDVDNDGDDVKEGIWIPSGLPIRSASDGTPYATFYSYTILDMDGRINVNTAGSWDQMPSNTYAYNAHVLGEYTLSEMTVNSNYNAFDSLFDAHNFYNPALSDNSSSPWFDYENRDDWLDDLGRSLFFPSAMNTASRMITRGSGFGPSEIHLIDALKKMALPIASSLTERELRRKFDSTSEYADQTAIDAYTERAPVLFNETAQNFEFLRQFAKYVTDQRLGGQPLEVQRLHFYVHKLFEQNAKESAFRAARHLFWNRNRLSGKSRLTEESAADANPHIEYRYNLSQPGKYSDNTTQTVDNSDAHRLYWNFTDGVYAGNLLSLNDADPERFTFPWRGKMRVSQYNLAARYYPTFDFNGLGLRSYDVLGNDFYTFAPKMSENPYLNNPYQSSDVDTPYQASLLEALLRSRDYDAKSLPLGLAKDLTNDSDGSALEQFFDNPAALDSARLNLTTISSDIPTPALVFPLGPETDGDGAFGIRDLVRRCVILEFYKKNQPTDANRLATDDPSYVAPTGVTAELLAAEADAKTIVRTKYHLASDFDFSTVGALNDEARRLAQALKIYVLYDNLSGFDFSDYSVDMTIGTFQNFTEKIDALTDEIFSILPEDTQNGRRLDLNALSRKASWLDRSYRPTVSSESTPELILGYTTYRGESEEIISFEGDHRGYSIDDIPKVRDNNDQVQIGDTPIVKGPADYHRHGLIERMKFARSLYVLLSVLTWQERNAEQIADFYLADAAPAEVKDYIEGVAASEISSLTDPTDDDRILANELFANRLAQWCVNFVDFTDPDATMTPFYYDPNPFDGWWWFPDTNANPWMSDSSISALRLFGLSGSDPIFGKDFYDSFDSILAAPDSTMLDASFTNAVNTSFVNLSVSYARNLANWLEGKNAAGTAVDFGFRRVWGMERPDLLLTETLSFHDLGIANTAEDNGNQKRTTGGDEDDDDFDQVRRPQGSSYFELYCAANPNIPQSPELYEFDTNLNQWKLRVSKMTPRQRNDSPYANKEFPVWRVAVSASCAPREEDSQDSANNNRQIRKKKNSVLQRLVGSSSYADPTMFSFQTRQFRDAPATWDGLDICVSNILGPTFVHQENSDDPDLSNEVEIDRIVWFGQAQTTDGQRELTSDLPDSTRIFWRITETGENANLYVLPNQYLVIGPEDERSIGSNVKDSSGDSENSTPGYFGVSSPNILKLSKLNPHNGVYARMGTYHGLAAGDDFSYKRGLNISEPLWTNGTDPYPSVATEEVTLDGQSVTVTDHDQPYENHPFEGPDNASVTNSPIKDDILFGLGTVPGYRSAFVQRVADPNLPYHPLLNPYITVDWNMMDLTVFNGEAETSRDENTSNRFVDKTPSGGEEDDRAKYYNPNNTFKLETGASQSLYGGFPTFDPNPNSLTETDTVFCSRQWGNRKQKGFYPETLQNQNNRANLWARPVNSSGLSAEAGLDTAVPTDELRKYNSVGDVMILLTASEKDTLVIPFAPKHTLGWYNDRGDGVDYDSSGNLLSADPPLEIEWYDNLETNWFLRYLAGTLPNNEKWYLGSPGQDSDSNGIMDTASPFEHLVWNDAPLSNPTELALVPASHPARFGMEFIRNSGGNGTDQSLSLANLYYKNAAESGRVLGRSLGSSVLAGTNRTNTFGYDGSAGTDHFYGPYLNFFNSVDGSIRYNTADSRWETSLGQSLNLAKLFDFVTIPSPYVGTRQPLTAWNTMNQRYVNQWRSYSGARDEALYSSALREPGKLNVNTIRSPAWAGLLGENTATTPFAEFLTGRLPHVEVPANPGTFTPDPLAGFVPFQPMQTASLAAKSGANDLLPVNSSFFAQNLAAPAQSLLNNGLVAGRERGNMFSATDEIQKLSGLTTNRSNVFAVWLTVGYFKVDRAVPGWNMPMYDPEGEPLAVPAAQVGGAPIPIFVNAQGAIDARVKGINDDLQPLDEHGLPIQENPPTMKVFSTKYKYAEYYKAIYPDGYTYGKELGSGGDGGVTRTRGFYLIDRSIPADFRRGRSKNWEDAILLERVL